MKDLSIYFEPISTVNSHNHGTIGYAIQTYTTNFPTLTKGGMALLYVPEFRGDTTISPAEFDDGFRSFFYALNTGIDWNAPLFDLGNILPGNELSDTYFAVSQVVAELVKNGIIPIVIGGSQDLTLAMFKGYSQLEQMVNLCCIDHALDLGDPENNPTADGFLSHLLMQRPCYLFNHANIGLQAPFAAKAELDLFEKLYFDVCRLGEYNADFRKAEPLLRNSDILSVDFKSIKAADLQHAAYSLPNGFYAEQICQIAKYAGLSDKLSTLGVFNFYPSTSSLCAAQLLAQIIWYFIDGVAHRKGDFPVGSKKDYTKFSVQLNDFKEAIVFYKSNKSERWWMEVPYPPKSGAMYERHHMVPCDSRDYELAMQNEMPDLWWKTYQKLG
jgi:formiminoglutamase